MQVPVHVDTFFILFLSLSVLLFSTDRNMWLQINQLGVYMGLTMLPIGGQSCIVYGTVARCVGIVNDE